MERTKISAGSQSIRNTELVQCIHLLLCNMRKGTLTVVNISAKKYFEIPLNLLRLFKKSVEFVCPNLQVAILIFFVFRSENAGIEFFHKVKLFLKAFGVSLKTLKCNIECSK